MKKIIFFIVMIFGICIFSDLNSFAHSGRTDSSGGHNCSAKSQAKGLCTGYHYHNEGATVNSVGEEDISSNYKNCDDFTDYDEVISYWNEKGYSSTYDPENLDGTGDTVDDGIPCEPPIYYDLTKVNNSPQQVAEKEESDGTELAEVVGFNDGYKNNKKNVKTQGSESYRKGYEESYLKAYQEGQQKFDEEKITIYNEGYSLGMNNEKLIIPTTLATVHIATFKSGFKKGEQFYKETQNEKYYNLGYNDGEIDKYVLPDIKEKEFLKSYKKGHLNRQKELRKEYIDQGYQAAFTNITYTKPNINNEKFIAWYKIGFESNVEVKELQDYAFEQGKSGEDLVIPDKYEQGVTIYEYYYEKGKEEYISLIPYIICIVVIIVTTIYLLYFRKRKKNNFIKSK